MASSGRVGLWLLLISASVGCADLPQRPSPPPPPIPQAPGALRWEFPTSDGLPLAIKADAQGRAFAYLAQKEGGLAVLALQGSSVPSVAARIERSRLANLDATSLVQAGNRVFVGLGDLFASQGSRVGLAVLDVTNPASPVISAQWISPTVMHGATALVVDQNTVYLAAMQDGVLIFDVSAPDTVVKVGGIVPDPNFPTPNPGPTALPNARGLALAGTLLYLANDAGGLRVLDVADRTQPREIGRYINARVVNKPQAYNSVALVGSRAFVALDYCGLEILDVTDPNAIRQTGWWNPWGCETPANTWFNSPGHTNQVVVDPARNLVYLSAGASEMLVVDVATPGQPTLRGQYEFPGGNQGVWGLDVSPTETLLTYITSLIPFRGTWAGVRSVATIR